MRKMTGILMASLLAASLAGCGGEVTTNAMLQSKDAAVTEEKADTSAYDEIIAGLTAGQGYAVIQLNTAEHPILLVSSATYAGDEAGTPYAIDATLYAYDPKGEVMEYGSIASAGTAYPISADEDYLYSGSGHTLHQAFISEEIGSLMTHEYVSESYDEKGDPSYSWFSLEEQYEGPVEDATQFNALFDRYLNVAEAIHFTPVE